VRGEQKADNLQAGLGANRGKAVGATGDQERIGSPHISTIAEIQKKSKFFPETPVCDIASHSCDAILLKRPPFSLLTAFPAHGILKKRTL
jgi:hypothetical protein